MGILTKLLISLGLSLTSGYLYHCGGLGRTTEEEKKEDPWIPLFLRMSWVRDWLCPAFSLATLFLFWQPNVWWGWLLTIPVYGIMGASFSTYWDKVFGYDNYYVHGFFVGLSVFPFCFVGLAWWIVLIQSILMALAMGILCARTKKAWLEECGRGFIATIVRSVIF